MGYTTPLGAITQNETTRVGQKAVALAALAKQKFSIPDTLIINSDAFQAILQENGLQAKREFLISHVQKKDPQSLMNVYTSMRKALSSATLPQDLESDLREMYESISAEGVGLSGKHIPIRVVVSTNRAEDPENNDTIIQCVQNTEEFFVAIREAWALAYLPNQLQPRLRENYNEKELRIALIIQVMDTPEVSVHTYSSLPQDSTKVYAQVYEGSLDLREKIQKDYYAIAKENLEIVAKDIKVQTSKLVPQKGTLVPRSQESSSKEEKLIKRDLIELARLTKKAERTLQKPVKLFFSVGDEQYTLLLANPLNFTPDIREEPLEIVDVEQTPEEQYANTQHAAEAAIQEATQQAHKIEKEIATQESRSEEEPSEKLLKTCVRVADKIIERKYEELYGQEGDEFSVMIERLNQAQAFPRALNYEAFILGHNAVNEDATLSPDEHARVVEELSFILNTF